MPVGRQRKRKLDRRRSPAFELRAAAAWPTEEPGCLACEMTPEQWEDVMRLVFEGKDVWIQDEKGYWYPLELQHMTTGPSGMTEMLGLVKQDAREDARNGHAHHSHTTHMKPR